jgi:hypothetical protein
MFYRVLNPVCGGSGTVKKTFYVLLIIGTALSASCTRDGENRAPHPAAGAENRPPAIVSASVVPEQPVSSTPLSVHFTADDPEGDPVSCVFRWYVDGELAQQGPEGSLQPGSYKKDSSVYVEIIPSDRFSAGKPFTTAAVTVINAVPEISSITLTPEHPTVGTVLTAIPAAADADGDWVRFKYQWFVNDAAAAVPEESSEFNTRGLRKKDRVHFVVTPSDLDGTGSPKASSVLELGNSAPRITSAPPYEYQDGVYRYQVTAQDPDGDRLTYSLAKAPSGMTIEPSSGLLTWEPKPVAEREEVVVKIVVSDGDGGSMDQEYSIILEP